jgi:hypothetical protein
VEDLNLLSAHHIVGSGGASGVASSPMTSPMLVSSGAGALSPGYGLVDDSSSVDSKTDLEARLRKQLEFYFSRENLATDSYLRSQMDNDQYVPIKVVAKFNKIVQMTNDLDLIVKALKGMGVVGM